MFTLIINPVSGRSNALKMLPLIRKILDSRQIAYNELYTSLPINSEQFLDVACGTDDTIAVLGGDGTMFDVINHLPALDMTLMYVPCGTGNDFVKCLKLPKDPVKAFLTQLDGDPHSIDLCSANGFRFMNICGVGFDVNVLRKVAIFKERGSGIIAYLCAVFSAVSDYQPLECTVSYDGGIPVSSSYTLISIGNGQYFGGGMKAVPNGNPSDGLIDIVAVDAVRKRQIWYLLPLFVLGKHVRLGFVTTRRCKSVHIEAAGLSIQMDGEITGIPYLDVTIEPSKIKMKY